MEDLEAGSRVKKENGGDMTRIEREYCYNDDYFIF